MIYKGWNIEKVEATQIGHKTNNGLRQQLGLGTKRKITYYLVTFPLEYGGGSSSHKTLKEAKERIDKSL